MIWKQCWTFSTDTFVWRDWSSTKIHLANAVWKCDFEFLQFTEENDGRFREMRNHNADRSDRVRTKRKVSGLHIYNICMCEMSMQSWRSQMTVSSLNPAQAKGQMAPVSVGRRCVHMCEFHTPTKREHWTQSWDTGT